MSSSRTDTGLIPWFARNPVAANLLMVLVIALGVMTAGSLRKEAFPSMEPSSLSISVSYDSGSADLSEEGVAMKIEEALEGISGIDTVTSTSTDRSVSVTVTKVDGYDLDVLLRDVKAAVDGISTFPADAKNPVISKARREEHALTLQLYGDADRRTLQHLADALKTDLLSKANISSVSISGKLDPQMVIEVDEGRLQALGLSLSDVEAAVNAGSSDTMTAVLRNRDVYLQLKASEQADTRETFRDIPLVTVADGTIIRLGDVASVRDTFDDSTAVLSRFNDHSSIGLEVITTGQEDITDSVDAALAVAGQWQASGRLPQSVHLATWHDRSDSIRARLDLLVSNAMMGIGFVFLLLAVFLNLTVAFWVAMGLPFIFFGTLFFMGDGLAGLSLNEFTTFGFIMALGIVVDDAVVVGESVYAVRSRDGDTLSNTIRGTLIVAVPTLFGVFTTVAAFAALAQIRGGLGQLYAQFAVIVAICLVLSILESKLILPAHLAHLKTHKAPGGRGPARWWRAVQHGADSGLGWVTERLYRPVIGWALQYRYAVVVLFLALFLLVITLPMTGGLRISFFPAIPGDTVRAVLTMQSDASFGQTHAALRLLEARAHETDVALRGGEGGDRPTERPTGIKHLQLTSSGDQAGRMTIELAPDAPYTINAFTREWRTRSGLPEGVRTLSIQNAPQMVDALRIELRADSDDTLLAAGRALQEHLAAIPAVSGLEENLSPGQPQLRLELTAQGRALGLSTDDLALQVLQAFSGRVVQRFQRNQDEVEVKVRYPEEARQNPADVLSARVRTADGVVLPLSAVAKVTYGYTRQSVTRIDSKRAVYLSADVDKDVLSSTALVAQLKADVAPRLLRSYPDLDIHFAGEAEEQAETESSMEQVFLIAMLVIYMLLAIPLKSYVQPVLIMTAIPFGIVGAMLGHLVHGMPLTILSLNGIIALSGVVVNDSLLLTARFNDLRGEGLTVVEAISEACRSRLRAVLLTSLTTAAGLLPLLAETSLQAQFLIPAAVSLAYGIMFATVITLILIPSLLMITHDVATGVGRVAKVTRDTE